MRILINTAALARCKNVLSPRELFQQFLRRGEKLLKQLNALEAKLHRAKAAVLMRGAACNVKICGFQRFSLNNSPV